MYDLEVYYYYDILYDNRGTEVNWYLYFVCWRVTNIEAFEGF